MFFQRAYGIVVVLTVPLLAGCAEPSALPGTGPYGEECEDYATGDKQEVLSYLVSKWPGNGSDGRRAWLGAMALWNLSSPEPSWGPAIDWSFYPPEDRPAFLHDILCYSQWRVENNSGLKEFQFWTYLGAPSEVLHETLAALRTETRRQAGESRDQPYFLYFRGERYGVEEDPCCVIISPPEPQDVQIASAQRAPREHDGEHDLAEEWIEVVNVGDAAFELLEWSLVLNRTLIYHFPAFVLPAGESIKVRTAAGTDTTTDLFMNRTETIWREGEVVSLHDNELLFVSSYKMD